MLQLMEPFAKKMQNEEKITDNENGINDQFDQKCAKRFDSFFFHLFQGLRVATRSRSCHIMATSKFRCAAAVCKEAMEGCPVEAIGQDGG